MLGSLHTGIIQSAGSEDPLQIKLLSEHQYVCVSVQLSTGNYFPTQTRAA